MTHPRLHSFASGADWRRWRRVDPALPPIVSGADQSWLDAVHSDDLAAVIAAWQEAETIRRPIDIDFRLAGGDEGQRVVCHAMPDIAPDGAIRGWCGSLLELGVGPAEPVRSETAAAFHSTAELQRRIRNMLAVIRSTVIRTLRADHVSETTAAHIAGRLSVLARTHEVFARTASYSVTLDELVREEIRAQCGMILETGPDPALSIDGPEVALGGRVADGLALALHELTTNAVKFGALGTDRARLRVRWHLAETAETPPPGEAGPWLVLEWEELGLAAGDPAAAETGFGTELILRALPYELGARTSWALRADGLRCRIEVSIPLPTGFPASWDG